MFTKTFPVKEDHVDFQGVVDGLYYPFYMEWTRHAFMKELIGLDLEKEFEQGRVHMIMEYTIHFRKSLKKGDTVEVTCEVKMGEKKNRVNFIQKMMVNGVIYADATFVATCLTNGRPSIPDKVIAAINA